MPDMPLQDALAQIALIRQQLSRTETFRGFRSLTVGFSAVVAALTAIVQAIYVADPHRQPGLYLTLWIGAAMISATICGAEMYLRQRRARCPSSRQLTVLAVGQFFPCLVAGALLTAVIWKHRVDMFWMLPGLWAMLFSLGVFATYRLLPGSIFWVAAYYLACGILCLDLGPKGALSPWTMAGTFGGGQLMTAWFLYWHLERSGAR